MAKQIHTHFSTVEAIAGHEDGFNPETRKEIVHIVEESYAELKLKLAMIIDVGTDVVKLCYQQEGDGFLAPTAYSHWQSVMSRLSNIADETVPIVERFLYLPITDAMLRELIPTAADREEIMKHLLKMTYPLHENGLRH